MSTIANMPKVKEALDNLREVLETERRDRIEFLRSCIGSWKEEIARAEKLPEQIARSEAEIAELETVSLPLSVTTLLGGAVRNCPLCLLPVMTSELNFRDGVVACRACRLNAEEYNKTAKLPGVCPRCRPKRDVKTNAFCPGCKNSVPIQELYPKPDDYTGEVDGKKVLVSLCDACREERSHDA